MHQFPVLREVARMTLAMPAAETTDERISQLLDRFLLHEGQQLVVESH